MKNPLIVVISFRSVTRSAEKNFVKSPVSAIEIVAIEVPKITTSAKRTAEIR